jgi:P-type Cu+ transporter
MEAYSKARTADAITALGRLRPSEALLLVPRDTTTTAKKSPKGEIEHREDVEKGDVDSEDSSQIVSPGWALEKIDAGLLEVGDVVRVQNGSTPPADGVVVSADGGAFDESSLTGESRLIKKHIGDEVFLGTINKSRMVDMKATAVGGETMYVLLF